VLVCVEEDFVLAIGQLSHSWLAGQLARAWGNARFPAPEPREEVVLGAAQHDIGWAGADRFPSLSSNSGAPRSFLETTVEEHLAIWRGAPDVLITQSMHAALVVSLHGRSLSELRALGSPEQAAALQGHIEEERDRQSKLTDMLGISEEQVQRTRRQMWCWDSLSLALCHGWRPFVVRDVPSQDGLVEIELRDRDGAGATLDPWPFASDRLEVRAEARRLARRYPDEATMRTAFDAAAPSVLTFELHAP
jgi:hypothetical protein